MKAINTAKWAVIMTKVRISQALARHKWQSVTFLGPGGRGSGGIVDVLAVRKDFGIPPRNVVTNYRCFSFK